MSYPKTVYEYQMQPIKKENGLFKVVRFKFVLLGPKDSQKRIVKTSTLYKNIGKTDAEEVLYLLQRNINPKKIKPCE